MPRRHPSTRSRRMNIITSTAFLQDFFAGPHVMGDRGRAFAQGYGNRVASARAFPPLGTPVLARRRLPASARPATGIGLGSRELCAAASG